MLEGIKLFCFGIVLLVIGIAFSVWPSYMIHLIYGIPGSTFLRSFRDSKVVPKINSEFMRLADEDPDMLMDKFPISIVIFRLIGIISMFIFIMLLCSIWVNS